MPSAKIRPLKPAGYIELFILGFVRESARAGTEGSRIFIHPGFELDFVQAGFGLYFKQQVKFVGVADKSNQMLFFDLFRFSAADDHHFCRGLCGVIFSKRKQKSDGLGSVFAAYRLWYDRVRC